MLRQLSITNYALIDNLQISFDAGLNIITGETGAGKSIILGALSLILGQRAESRYFFNQQKKCVIEGAFKINGFQLKTFFEENDLDHEEDTVLRREISADGKSRAFINDTPVNLNLLRALGEKLIEVHSQQATQEINDPRFQLMVVDAAAGNSSLLDDYQSKFSRWKKGSAQLKQLSDDNEKAKADLDYYQFQFDELEKANLLEGEQEQLEKELYALNNADDIKRNLQGANYLLQDSDTAAIFQLREAEHQLSAVEKFDPAAEELSRRLHSLVVELKDISAEIASMDQQTQNDPARADDANSRLSIIYNLQKKHRVNSNTELLVLQEDLSAKINQAAFGEDAIEKLRLQLNAEHQELVKLATRLSGTRNDAVQNIETAILTTLAEMGMANSALNIVVDEIVDLNFYGRDSVKFLFSANKGHALADMSKVASGGELSRLMLSVKSLMASNTALPTIIFDEIDTGVSGQIAQQVGSVMEQLSHNLQVITITHLPQIAAKGAAHYFVYKDDESDISRTRIRQLNNEERVTEIAKMLSGDQPGESARQNAIELLAAKGRI